MEVLLQAAMFPAANVLVGRTLTDIHDDVGGEQAEFVYLSDVFKYISHFRRGGHQIGRKVGDMLEVLTYAAVYRDCELRKRLILEPKVIGFSGAGHKVEFGLFKLEAGGAPAAEMSQLFAFIECKKVGVEQTVNGTFKNAFGRRGNIVPFGTPIMISLNPRWAARSIYSVRFAEDTDDQATIKIERNGAQLHSSGLQAEHRYMIGLTVDGEPFFVDQERSLRDIPSSIRACKILKVSGIGKEGVQCILEDCLTGPQTPEKAKQASFVALDVRKGLSGQFDKVENERDCLSVLVLTEFSHWEPKSVNMIKASIDVNLVVDDSLVIEAMTAYEAEYGEFFLEKITKEEFRRSDTVRSLALNIVNSHDGRIFRDIIDGRYKALSFGDGQRLEVA